MHTAGFAKPHFVFGRMDIDVHGFFVHFEVQDEHRVSTMKHHITIGLANGMAHQFIPNRSAVDIKKLLIGEPAMMRRQPHPTVQAHPAAAFINHHGLLNEIRGQYLRQALLNTAGGQRQRTSILGIVRSLAE